MADNCSDNCEYNYSNVKALTIDSLALTFVSSILSIIGSVLIIVSFVLWKDVRQSTARVILLFLAIADLGTGLSYLMAVTGYVAFYRRQEFSSKKYHNFCRVQSFFTTFFPVSSFFWTVALGMYFLFALTFRRPRWGPKLLFIINVIIWLGTFVFLVVMSSLHVLGPTTTNLPVAGAWCFVSDEAHYGLTNDSLKYWVFEGVCGKFWELLSFCIVLACYGIICFAHRCKITQRVAARNTSKVVTSKADQEYETINRAMQNIDFKLMAIPIVFIGLRIWGVIRYCVSVVPHCHPLPRDDGEFCMNEVCYYTLYYVTYFPQAFCDPLQGFGNAILFVFFAKTIRVRYKRLFYIMFYKLLSRFQRKDETGTSVETTPLLKRKSIDKINEKQAEAEVSSSDESFVEISYKSVINFKNSEY